MNSTGNPPPPPHNNNVAAACNLVSLICVVPPVANVVSKDAPPPSCDAITTGNLVRVLAATLGIPPGQAVQLLQETVQLFQNTARQSIDCYLREQGTAGGEPD